METHRCFLSIDLPLEVKQNLARLQTALPPAGLRFVKSEQQHITLAFFPSLTANELSAMQEKFTALTFVPFTISLQDVGVFPSQRSPRVLWVGCQSPGLLDLVEQLHQKLGAQEIQPFSGHITLARITRRVDLLSFLEQYQKQQFGSFVADRFLLVKSTLTPDGPVHETLQEFIASI